MTDRIKVQTIWNRICADPDAMVIIDDPRPGHVVVADRSAATGLLYGMRSFAPGDEQEKDIAVWTKTRPAVIDRRGQWVDDSPEALFFLNQSTPKGDPKIDNQHHDQQRHQ